MNAKKKKTIPSWKRNNPPVSKLDEKELEEIRDYVKGKDFFFWKSKTKLAEIRKYVSATYKKKIGLEQLKAIVKEECALYKKITLRSAEERIIFLDGEGWYQLSLAVARVKAYAKHVSCVSDVCLLVCSIERVRCNVSLLDGMRDCHKWWLK